jgi:hypothetical protein
MLTQFQGWPIRYSAHQTELSFCNHAEQRAWLKTDFNAVSVPEPTAASEAPSTALLYVVREAGIVVDLVCQPLESEHPTKHALDLLLELMRDDPLAGQPATEKALRKYYIAVSRSQRVKPFPWLGVVRSFNVIPQADLRSHLQKTYRRVYEGGRFRKRRVYRIPLLEEYEEAAGPLGRRMSRGL